MNKRGKILIILTFILGVIISFNIDATINKNNNFDEKKKVNTRAANSFDLSSEVSVDKLSNYKDTAIINFKINHRDPSSSLYNGTLEIDFGKGMFEVINFPSNSTANSNVKSATMNYKTNKLSVVLKTPITTGTQFDYSVIVRLSGTVEANANVTATAELNGDNAASLAYNKETAITPVVIADVPKSSIIDPDNPEWKLMMNPRNWTVYPGASVDTYNYINKSIDSNASFKNLRVVWEKGNSKEIVKSGATRFIYLQDTTNSSSVTRQCNEVSNTATEIVCEYGEVNGNIYDRVLLYPSGAFLVPSDAVNGTIYSSNVKVYDEDNLITSYPMNITVKSLETSVDLNPSLNRTTISQGDYFDWYDFISTSSGGTGVKDLKTTIDIPDGISPVGMYLTDGSTKIKSLEIYQNSNWIKIDEVTANSQFFDDFDKYLADGKIEKIKYERADSLSISYARQVFFRFVSDNIVDGQNYSIKTSEVTYLDHDDIAKSLDLSAAKYTVTTMGVNKTTDTPKIMGYTKANGVANDFGNIFFNGDTIIQNLTLMNSLGNLENPYVFVKVPKGIKNVDDIKIGQAYNQNPGYSMTVGNIKSGSISKPKGDLDFKTDSIELSDGSTLIYYVLPKGQLLAGAGPNDSNSTRIQLYIRMILESLPSGEYEVEFGAGSMTSDNYNINKSYDSRTDLNILKLENLPDDYKVVIPGVTSSKYLTLKRKFTVGINNSVTSKMEIKGSQDSKYVDATATNAESLPGKEVNYRVTLTNKGTNNLTNFEAVDILPYVGDTSVNNPSIARNSDYRVNLLGEVKVLVDGIETSDAYVLYSTSTDPVRYIDSGSNTVGTGVWTNTPPGDLTSVRSIKVVMPSKDFKINSTIELSFKGSVPLDVPRDGTSIAYNSIGISGNTVTLSGNQKFVTEPAKGGVKATLPATDLELSGKVYMDFNTNGNSDTGELGYNGVTLNLYEKQADNTYKKIDIVTSAPDSSSNSGIFGFTGIVNGTYKIEAIKPKSAEFVSTGSNSFELNGTDKAWLKYNGSTELNIDDLAGANPKKITDLAGPFDVSTEFNGTIKFVDKNGSIVTGNEYGKGFKVQLQKADGSNIGSSVLTSGDGSFNISEKITAKADYKLALTKTKSGFAYPSINDSSLNTSSGVYTLKDVEPGLGGVADIYISDTDLPTTSITIDKSMNPTSIVVNATDVTTDATYEWIIKKNGVQVETGTGAVSIPREDGEYTIESIATDSALNESGKVTESFSVDKTAPIAKIDIISTNKYNPTKVELSATDTMDSTPKLTYTLKKDGSQVDSGIDVTSPQDIVSKATEDGVYTVELTAKDSAGNISTKVSDTFTVDNTKPTASIDIVPVSKYNPTKVELSAIDNLDGAPKLTYVFKKDGTQIDSGTDVGSPQDIISKVTGEGVYTVELTAKDNASNVSTKVSDTFTVDNTKPVASIDIVPVSKYNPTKVELSATDNLDDVPKLTYTLKNSGGGVVDSGTDIVSPQNIISKATADGVYIVELTAKDNAGNVSIKVTDTFTVDNTKPVATINIVPVSKYNPTKVELSATDNLDNAPKLTYVLKKDGTQIDAGTDVTSPQDLISKATGEGTYTIELTAKDSAGNVSAKVSDTFIIDTTKPVGIINITPSIYNPTKVEIKGEKGGVSTGLKLTYTLKLGSTTKDSGTDVTSPQDLISKATEEGIYTVELTVKDAASNVSDKVEATFTIDKTKPVITTTSTSQKGKIGATKPTDLKTLYGMSASDNIDTSINASKVTVTDNINMSKVGTYNVTFEVTDEAGNKQVKEVTYIVEAIVISGIVYEDANYNSKNDDSDVISGVSIRLLDKDTNTQVASTTSDSAGKYEFKLPFGSETTTKYIVDVVEKSGYLLANKGSDSIIDLSTLKSDEMSISGQDHLNKHIGMARDVSASLAPTTLKVYVGDTVVASYSVTNGTKVSESLNNTNVSISDNGSGGYNVTGKTAGQSILTAKFTDGYKRNEVLKTITINTVALPTAKGSNVTMSKGEEKASGLAFTPTDGLVSYTSSAPTKVSVDSTGKLTAIDKGNAIISGKVVTSDVEAKEAETRIIALVGNNTVIGTPKTRANIYIGIAADDFMLSWKEANTITDDMVKSKSEVFADLIDLDNMSITPIDLADIAVDYSSIDLSSIPEDGTKDFTIKYEARGVETTSTVTIAGKNTIIDPITGEGISAKDFNINVSDIAGLNDSKVMSLADAKAWKLADNSAVNITNVDYSTIDASKVPDNGVKAFDVTFKTAAGTTKVVKAYVAGKNVVINDGEAITAQGFSIKANKVKELTKDKVISLAKAKAWNVIDDSEVTITKVDYSKVQAKVGTYKVTFTTDKGTTITIDVKVTKADVEDLEEEEDDDTPIPKGGSNELTIALLLLVVSGFTYGLTRRKININ